MATRIDGTALAAKVKAQVAEKAAKLPRQPGLAVVLVGEDPASQVYVRGKEADCGECGIRSFPYRLPAETTQRELLDLIEKLNRDPAVDGILVQLPLPKPLEADPVIAAIAPDMELTVITLDEAPDILPCFDEDDAYLNIPDSSLLLSYNPAQVLKLAGKRYLTGPVILVRTNMDGEFISLTIDQVYLFQKYLMRHSVTLMADGQKLPCICID